MVVYRWIGDDRKYIAVPTQAGLSWYNPTSGFEGITLSPDYVEQVARAAVTSGSWQEMHIPDHMAVVIRLSDPHDVYNLVMGKK